MSLIFTKATNQTIILGTPPKHVLSTSILWASLAHDKRFEQVPMNQAAPGDIIIGSGWQQGADGYAGIVVDHGRIVSNSSQGVRYNSSLAEIQRSHPAMVAFRYVGFWNYYRSKTFANAGFNPAEARIPAGQPGGGQWTSGGAGGVQMAPSTTSFSGRNDWTPGQNKKNVEAGKGQATDRAHAGGPLTNAQRKLLEQKNAEAVAIIARLGDKGEKPDTPESILDGPLKTTWGSNAGWIPGTPHWDLRQQYKGYSDEDIALMEAARRNGVRAAVLLAQAGLLPKSQVTALQLRGMGVLADTTLNLGLMLAPYDSIAALGSRAVLGPTDVAVGTGVRELTPRLEREGTGVHPPSTSYQEIPDNTPQYIASLPTRPAAGSGASKACQIENAGPIEYLVSGGGAKLWADGVASPPNIMEVKFVGDPSSSPFIPGTSIPQEVREKILAQVEDEFSRMKKNYRRFQQPAVICKSHNKRFQSQRIFSEFAK